MTSQITDVLHICKRRVMLPSFQMTQIYDVRCSCPACHCTSPSCCPPGKDMNNMPQHSSIILLAWCPVPRQHVSSFRFATDSCYLGLYLCPPCSTGHVQSFPFSDFFSHTRHCNSCFGSLPNDGIISSIFICSQLFILHSYFGCSTHHKLSSWTKSTNANREARRAHLCLTSIVFTLARAASPCPPQHPDCHPAAFLNIQWHSEEQSGHMVWGSWAIWVSICNTEFVLPKTQKVFNMLYVTLWAILALITKPEMVQKSCPLECAPCRNRRLCPSVRCFSICVQDIWASSWCSSAFKVAGPTVCHLAVPPQQPITALVFWYSSRKCDLQRGGRCLWCPEWVYEGKRICVSLVFSWSPDSFRPQRSGF